MKSIAILLGICSLLLCGISSAQTDPRPNIIFFEVDDLLPRFMNKLGNGFGITPNLDKLASSGIYFKNAVCQGVQCGPSRNSLVTGLYPHNLGFYVNKQLPHLPKDSWTFPRELNKAGYQTAYIGKSHLKPYYNRKEAKEKGLSKSQIHQQFFGFHFVNCTGERGKMAGEVKKGTALDFPFTDYLQQKGKLDQFISDNKAGTPSSMTDDFDYLDGYITKELINYVDTSRDQTKPFFVWMNYCLPHAPYDVPQAYFDAAAKIDIPPPMTSEFGHPVPEAQLRHNKPAVAASVEKARIGEVANVMFIDKMLGLTIDNLEKQGLLESTVIFFFSDHSIFLGNHGRIHKQSLYEECVNTSLVISYPKRFLKDTVSSHPVELLDIVPTAFELAGIKNPNQVSKNGLSLIPVLEGTGSNGREIAYSEIHDGIGATSAEYRYMNVGGEEFLYDREQDPIEMVNIASKKPKITSRFRRKLEKWKAATGPFLDPVKPLEKKK